MLQLSGIRTPRCEYPKWNKSSEELLAGQPVTSIDSQELLRWLNNLEQRRADVRL